MISARIGVYFFEDHFRRMADGSVPEVPFIGYSRSLR